MKTTKVLLVEDHAVVRQGFRRLLDAEPDFEVVGEAANGFEAVELALKLNPTVIVMDIAMPQLNGLEATRQILRANPEAKILILSAHSDEAYREHLSAVGATGFLIKQTSSQMVVNAIREVASGKKVFPNGIENRLKSTISGDQPHGEKAQSLSSREVEVLQLIAEGAANKIIAGKLGISIKTVEKHRQKVMDKLRIHDTAGLTRYAIGTGIIECSVQLTIT